eukprot:snap_masked-scaffold_7-processed-gene-14.33-mRNA-1 protein AED:1.00 eAED:1.00 QI:0/0/0/0/1/1/2/0/108
MARRKTEVTNVVDEIRSDLQYIKPITDSKFGLDIKRTNLTYFYALKKDKFVMQQRIIHHKVYFYKGDINNFIKKDPPYPFMTKNPIRGASNFYDTMAYHDLRKLNFKN